jgi:GxxExxY protein
MSHHLTEKIIGAAIEVHRILGPGLLESIYEEALCHELGLRGIRCERQKEVDVIYKGHVIKGQRLDLLVAGEVVVELKAVAKLPDVATAQVLSYLKATGLKRALRTESSEFLCDFDEMRIATEITENTEMSIPMTLRELCALCG